MRFRISLAILLALGLMAPGIAPAGKVIKAVVEKHKKNPESLHAKIQANHKDKKAMGGHHGRKK